MKMNVTTLKQQTQDLFLRLFVESSSGIGTTPARSNYTCAHCGTYARNAILSAKVRIVCIPS